MTLPTWLHTIFQKIFSIFGIILQNKNTYYLPWPTAFSAVDIAIVDPYKNLILLGQKRATGKWCIIGGFTDPRSKCDEEDAIRELDEETGLFAHQHELKFIRNLTVDDGRYAHTSHRIRTHFYLLHVDSTKVVSVPKDPEIKQTQWFDLNDRFKRIGTDDPYLNKGHQELMAVLKEYMGV